MVRGTLLYAYYNFNIYFFKIFIIHVFFANEVPNHEVLKINWNLVQGYIVICLLRFLMFIFSKFLRFIFIGQIWSQNIKFSKLTKIWYQGTLLYAHYDSNNFFKIFVSHIFLGKFGFIVSSSTKRLNFCRGVHCYMLIMMLMLIFLEFCYSYNFGEI